MKIVLIINKNRLAQALNDKLESKELTEKYQIEYDVIAKNPEEFKQALSEINLAAYNAIVIGGGDGTVRSIVQYVYETDIPIAILPLGTFNLLAKSLGHPADIEQLFDLIKNNKTKMIDLATVNDKVIINHAWIGFYYHLLKAREKHKHFLGKSRLFKILFNTLNFLKTFPIYVLNIQSDHESIQYKTCLVFVGNNESYTSFFDFGEHKYLSTGLLSITILNCKTRWQLIVCLLSLLFNKYKSSKYITTFTTKELSISTQLHYINMVIDGELFKLEKPLYFKMLPKQLKVFVP